MKYGYMVCVTMMLGLSACASTPDAPVYGPHPAPASAGPKSGNDITGDITMPALAAVGTDLAAGRTPSPVQAVQALGSVADAVGSVVAPAQPEENIYAELDEYVAVRKEAQRKMFEAFRQSIFEQCVEKGCGLTLPEFNDLEQQALGGAQ